MSLVSLRHNSMWSIEETQKNKKYTSRLLNGLSIVFFTFFFGKIIQKTLLFIDKCEDVFGLCSIFSVDIIIDEFTYKIGEVKKELMLVFKTDLFIYYLEQLLIYFPVLKFQSSYIITADNQQQFEGQTQLHQQSCYQNTIIIVLIILSQMRYSRLQKNHMLPKLNDKSTAFKDLIKRQQVISNQISNLNNVLDTQNLTTINGLIFTGEIKNRLFDDIVQCIHKDYRLIAYGFEFWQENTIDQERIYVKKEIFPQKLTFKQKLHQISIKVIENYEEIKKKQLKNIQYERWRINSSIQSKSSSKTAKRVDTSASQNITPIKRNRQNHNYSYFTSKKMMTQMPETHKKRINFEQVERAFKKLSNIVTIWLPPKTYPQFYGIIVPLKMQKTSKKCIIRKYIFFKQGLNEIFFSNIIQYLSLYFNLEIQELQMKMTKQNYSNYFQRCGWKMKSWEGTEKINAIFSKK